MKRTVTVCDVCERVGIDTQPYAVRQGQRSKRLDLCADDAGPLEKLMGLGSMSAPAKRTAAKRAPAKKTPGRRRRVTTMEEIEKQKKAAKKA